MPVGAHVLKSIFCMVMSFSQRQCCHSLSQVPVGPSTVVAYSGGWLAYGFHSGKFGDKIAEPYIGWLVTNHGGIFAQLSVEIFRVFGKVMRFF